MPAVAAWQLRAAFARRMAAAYAREVPAYTTLVEVAAQVNAEVVARDGVAAQRLGSIERVTAERHGAIRVGTPRELRQVGRIFAALGMYPVGYYDLRDAARAAVPVVSTAFRPVDAVELARNPFRMFTSLLVTDDRRFFDPELQTRLTAFLDRRELFGPRLLALAEQAVADTGLSAESAEEFLALATAAFELSTAAVDAGWYAELSAVSAVAADIGGVASTHINHLTPRVLAIDELYRRMTARGVEMINTIQGPPAWDGPDVLLRQTSFRALAEARTFRAADGAVYDGELRVRFGEVEARGIALTPAGRDRYDLLLSRVDAALRAGDGRSRPEVAAAVWRDGLPATELGLLREGLAYFTYEPAGAVPAQSSTVSAAADADRADRADSVDRADRADRADPREHRLARLVAAGALVATPIVYEDFLPRSAAGIFQSNLTDAGRKDGEVEGTRRDAGWLADVIGAPVAEPTQLYAAQQQASLAKAAAGLGIELD